MSSNFSVVTNDGHFQTELTRGGNKLVIVDFTSARCGPCQRASPLFEEMSSKYKNANFLKVDIQNCPNSAQLNGVQATPTFIFFRNKTKIDSIRGANMEALEAKIKQHYGDGESEDSEDCGVPGHMDLISMINKAGCECLNESETHTFSNILASNGGHLESDADEQLIIYIAFNQSVKIHSLRVKAPADSGPKNIKLFINQPYTLDFDAAETGIPVQELELSKKDLDGDLINLKYVRFQNVMNLAIFIQDNQSGSEITKVSNIQLIGSPVQTTNMSDFKRIAGKKGESH
ncbi:UNVERIFIED_CONTAM: hypothetical protein RMT77_000258 [Armadillidium vulgare]